MHHIGCFSLNKAQDTDKKFPRKTQPAYLYQQTTCLWH